MHYYSHNIPDFNNATRHLTRVERSVYRDLIELYYDKESALTSDINYLAKRILCPSEEEKEALKNVLEEFFELRNDGYCHERCQSEIGKYHAQKDAKSRAGKASAESRKRDSKQKASRKTAVDKQNLTRVEQVPDTEPTDVQLTNNHKPITNNHKPTTNKPNKQSEAGSLVANDRFEDFWNAYPVKKGKSKAMERWGKSNLNAIADEIIGKVGLQKNQDVDWLRGAIPHPTTYLNGERWKDEVTRARSGQAGGSASERGTQGARDWLEKRANG